MIEIIYTDGSEAKRDEKDWNTDTLISVAETSNFIEKIIVDNEIVFSK